MFPCKLGDPGQMAVSLEGGAEQGCCPAPAGTELTSQAGALQQA